MDILQIIVLSLVQGLTEFLPVSSSAHLVLVPYLGNWPDQGLAFDVAMHVGSLMAVVIYFRSTLQQLFLSWLHSCHKRPLNKDGHLAWGIIFATLPTVIVGLLLHDSSASLRSLEVIASTTIIFALLLWLADYLGKKQRTEYQISWPEMLIIGSAQAIALLPGTSRSGITITAALFLGMSATASARFSFLLSIPIIIAAGSLLVKDLLVQSAPVQWLELGLATLLSGISAWIAIYFFIRLVEQIGMLPFILYRLLLGAVLLFFIF